MKIIKLTSENFKRIKAVEISPTENTVVIAGRNAQGKTSVLDAIWCTLGGGAANKTVPQPVREGETDANVEIDLGEMRVKRTWDTEGKTRLTVSTPEGAKFQSPQTVLDGLVGSLSFDPLAFADTPEKEQRQQLLQLIQKDDEIEALNTERQRIFDERREINREIKTVEALIDNELTQTTDIPDQLVNVTELMDELENAENLKKQAEAQIRQQETLKNEVNTLQEQLEAKQKQLLEELQTETPFVPNIDAIKEKLRDVDATNATIRAKQTNNEHIQKLSELKNISQTHTQQLDKIDQQKRDILTNTPMPIPGLGVNDTSVTFNGIPLNQASSAERLRVSMAVAMATNPELRVIRITDGSLLDTENMHLIEHMAQESDYQIWIEVVDETGERGITIEDGKVL